MMMRRVTHRAFEEDVARQPVPHFGEEGEEVAGLEPLQVLHGVVLHPAPQVNKGLRQGVDDGLVRAARVADGVQLHDGLA